MLRQIHRYPKLVVNDAATSTDTIHRVRLLHKTDAAKLACVMVNAITFAFAETWPLRGGRSQFEPASRSSQSLMKARIASTATKFTSSCLPTT